MFERLEQIESKYEELNQALASPGIVSDTARYQKTAKAHSELSPIVEKYREFKDLTRGISESKSLVEGETDPEMLAYAHEELAQLEKEMNAQGFFDDPERGLQGGERHAALNGTLEELYNEWEVLSV